MWSRIDLRADLNSDNLRIFRGYLQISDHCRVRVRVKDRIRAQVSISVRLGLELQIVVYKLLEKVTNADKLRD